MSEISLENYVKVKITERGKEILQKDINFNIQKMSEVSNMEFTPINVERFLDKEGNYRCELSDLMRIFGDKLHEVPFEGDIKVIEFDKKHMMKILSESIDEFTGGKLDENYTLIENEKIHIIKFIEGTCFEFVLGKAKNEITGEIVDSINVYLVPMSLLPGLAYGKINNDYVLDLCNKNIDLLHCICKIKENREENKGIENNFVIQKNGDRVFRGGVYYAEINTPMQGKSIRPVLVVSTDKMNKYSPSVIAIPLTANIGRLSDLVHIKLKSEDFPFLKKDNLLLVDNLTTVCKSSIKHLIGEINKETMSDIECCIKNIFDM